MRARTFGLCAALTVGVSWAQPAAAQFESYPMWLERSYFAITPVSADIVSAPAWYPLQGRDEDDELMFEARISPQLYLYNSLESDVFTGNDAQWSFALAFTPMFIVRQLGSFSAPLRSPSFMPKFALQAHYRLANDGINRPVNFFTAQVEHGHHSNGGEPCSFVEERRTRLADGTETCVLSVNRPATQLVVDTTGSFSTNYFRFGGFWNRFSLERQKVGWNLGLGLQLEVHPEGQKFLGLVGGGLGAEMHEIYGPTRWRFRGQATKGFERGPGLRLAGDFEFMRILYDERPSPDATSNAWTGEVTLTLDDGVDVLGVENLFSGWGLYVRFYQGQDYYNQMFFRDIRRLHIGLLVIDQFDWRLEP